MKIRLHKVLLWLALVLFAVCLLLWREAFDSVQTNVTSSISTASSWTHHEQLIRHNESDTAVPTNASRRLTLWSTDFHISPVADVKDLLSSLGVRVIDKSLSGHCHLTNTCAVDLHVLTQENGIGLTPCANHLRRAFYDYYRSDPDFLSADAILCQHASALCELYLPFKKPLIVIASTRYEVGRHEAHRWQRWNANLQRIARTRGNVVAANNLYDVEYIKYFTDLQSFEIQWLSSYCGYVRASYSYLPTALNRKTYPILLAPSRGIHPTLQSSLSNAVSQFNAPREVMQQLRIESIRAVYPVHYEYAQLAKHPAIVLLPYQVSIMSFFEFYRMNIPLFVPSLSLLTQWQLQWRVVHERTWPGIFARRGVRESVLPRHENSSCRFHSDPNNDLEENAVREWLSLSDFYQWPHVQQFESWEELLQMLSSHLSLSSSSRSLQTISEQMKIENARAASALRAQWTAILNEVQSVSQREAIPLSVDINDELFSSYGIRLSEDCEGEI